MEVTKEFIAKATGVSLAIAAGLGLTACTSSEITPNYDGEVVTEPEMTDATTKDSLEAFKDFTVQSLYTESGKRITVYGDPTGGRRGVITSNIAYCDGFDLIEMPLQYYWDGGNSVVTRSVGHQACADGRLDPSDFTIE